MIKNFLDPEPPNEDSKSAEKAANITDGTFTLNLEAPSDQTQDQTFQTGYIPPSTEETIRNTGLAWSAGIVFFGSIVFMLVLGWFADLLLGSSPWGIIAGIVLGSIIGFVQFFRITSQILQPRRTQLHQKPLLPDETDKE